MADAKAKTINLLLYEERCGLRLPRKNGEGGSPPGCRPHSGQRCLRKKEHCNGTSEAEHRVHGAVSGDEAAVEAIGEQIDGLRAEHQGILAEAAERTDLQERMNDMIYFLDEMPTMLTEYSDAITRRLVEKITIYDEKIVVELKSGLQMEVNA